MVTAGIPALLQVGHLGVEETLTPWLGALGEHGRAQIADDGRATHLESLGHVSRRDALCVEGLDLLVERQSARPPCLAGALVSGRATE
jgi:hypothetical protein